MAGTLTTLKAGAHRESYDSQEELDRVFKTTGSISLMKYDFKAYATIAITLFDIYLNKYEYVHRLNKKLSIKMYPHIFLFFFLFFKLKF